MTPQIARVVVALDAVSENRAAIDTAARLAARWRARLHAVFIEDDDLLRLANLPFARQVSLGTGVEQLTLQHAERQIRAFAEYARRDLEAAAQRHSIAWTFDVVRGAPGTAMTDATAGDFLVVGSATRPIGAHFRIDCRWWSAVEAPASSFLLAARQWEQTAAVIALLRNREPAAERLIDAAARVSQESGGDRLTVLCSAELSEAEGFDAWLSDRLAGYPLPVEIDPGPSDLAGLIRRIVELDGRLIAIAADDPHARPQYLRRMIAQTGCDVLVVR